MKHRRGKPKTPSEIRKTLIVQAATTETFALVEHKMRLLIMLMRLLIVLNSWVHTGRSIALRSRAAGARSKCAGGVDVPRAIHAQALERALPGARDPYVVGFCASLKGASVAWRAQCGRLCVIRAIHHTMDISQSRRLISLYKEFKCLWDPKDVNFTNRGVRDDAWRQISRDMENKPIEDLKKKMRSLAGGYRREKFREKQSRITGSGKKLLMLR